MKLEWLLLLLGGVVGLLIERSTRYRANPVELVELDDGEAWNNQDWKLAVDEAASFGRSDVAAINKLRRGRVLWV